MGRGKEGKGGKRKGGEEIRGGKGEEKRGRERDGQQEKEEEEDGKGKWINRKSAGKEGRKEGINGWDGERGQGDKGGGDITPEGARTVQGWG